MIFADYDGQILSNIIAGPCAKSVDEAKANFACCDPNVTDAKHGGPTFLHAHHDPAPGCTRVVLAAWPPDGFAGPWGFAPDGTTQQGHPVGTAVPHAENTRLLRQRQLDDAALDKFRLLQRRAALLQAKRDVKATDAEIAAVEKRIAEALTP